MFTLLTAASSHIIIIIIIIIRIIAVCRLSFDRNRQNVACAKIAYLRGRSRNRRFDKRMQQFIFELTKTSLRPSLPLSGPAFHS